MPEHLQCSAQCSEVIANWGQSINSVSEIVYTYHMKYRHMLHTRKPDIACQVAGTHPAMLHAVPANMTKADLVIYTAPPVSA